MNTLNENLAIIRSYCEQRPTRNQGYRLGEAAMLQELSTLLEGSRTDNSRRLSRLSRLRNRQALDLSQHFIDTYIANTPESSVSVAA